MARIVKIQSAAGNSVLFETESELGVSSTRVTRGGTMYGDFVSQSNVPLNESICTLLPAVEDIASALKGVGAKELEISFGIKVLPDGGVFIAQGQNSSSFLITAKF